MPTILGWKFPKVRKAIPKGLKELGLEGFVKVNQVFGKAYSWPWKVGVPNSFPS